MHSSLCNAFKHSLNVDATCPTISSTAALTSPPNGLCARIYLYPLSFTRVSHHNNRKRNCYPWISQADTCMEFCFTSVVCLQFNPHSFNFIFWMECIQSPSHPGALSGLSLFCIFFILHPFNKSSQVHLYKCFCYSFIVINSTLYYLIYSSSILC